MANLSFLVNEQCRAPTWGAPIITPIAEKLITESFEYAHRVTRTASQDQVRKISAALGHDVIYSPSKYREEGHPVANELYDRMFDTSVFNNSRGFVLKADLWYNPKPYLVMEYLRRNKTFPCVRWVVFDVRTHTAAKNYVSFFSNVIEQIAKHPEKNNDTKFAWNWLYATHGMMFHFVHNDAAPFIIHSHDGSLFFCATRLVLDTNTILVRHQFGTILSEIPYESVDFDESDPKKLPLLAQKMRVAYLGELMHAFDPREILEDFKMFGVDRAFGMFLGIYPHNGYYCDELEMLVNLKNISATSMWLPTFGGLEVNTLSYSRFSSAKKVTYTHLSDSGGDLAWGYTQPEYAVKQWMTQSTQSNKAVGISGKFFSTTMSWEAQKSYANGKFQFVMFEHHRSSILNRVVEIFPLRVKTVTRDWVDIIDMFKYLTTGVITYVGVVSASNWQKILATANSTDATKFNPSTLLNFIKHISQRTTSAGTVLIEGMILEGNLIHHITCQATYICSVMRGELYEVLRAGIEAGKTLYETPFVDWFKNKLRSIVAVLTQKDRRRKLRIVSDLIYHKDILLVKKRLITVGSHSESYELDCTYMDASAEYEEIIDPATPTDPALITEVVPNTLNVALVNGVPTPDDPYKKLVLADGPVFTGIDLSDKSVKECLTQYRMAQYQGASPRTTTEEEAEGDNFADMHAKILKWIEDKGVVNRTLKLKDRSIFWHHGVAGCGKTEEIWKCIERNPGTRPGDVIYLAPLRALKNVFEARLKKKFARLEDRNHPAIARTCDVVLCDSTLNPRRIYADEAFFKEFPWFLALIARFPDAEFHLFGDPLQCEFQNKANNYVPNLAEWPLTMVDLFRKPYIHRSRVTMDYQTHRFGGDVITYLRANGLPLELKPGNTKQTKLICVPFHKAKDNKAYQEALRKFDRAKWQDENEDVIMFTPSSDSRDFEGIPTVAQVQGASRRTAILVLRDAKDVHMLNMPGKWGAINQLNYVAFSRAKETLFVVERMPNLIEGVYSIQNFRKIQEMAAYNINMGAALPLEGTALFKEVPTPVANTSVMPSIPITPFVPDSPLMPNNNQTVIALANPADAIPSGHGVKGLIPMELESKIKNVMQLIPGTLGKLQSSDSEWMHYYTATFRTKKPKCQPFVSRHKNFDDFVANIRRNFKYIESDEWKTEVNSVKTEMAERYKSSLLKLEADARKCNAFTQVEFVFNSMSTFRITNFLKAQQRVKTLDLTTDEGVKAGQMITQWSKEMNQLYWGSWVRMATMLKKLAPKWMLIVDGLSEEDVTEWQQKATAEAEVDFNMNINIAECIFEETDVSQQDTRFHPEVVRNLRWFDCEVLGNDWSTAERVDISRYLWNLFSEKIYKSVSQAVKGTFSVSTEDKNPSGQQWTYVINTMFSAMRIAGAINCAASRPVFAEIGGDDTNCVWATEAMVAKQNADLVTVLLHETAIKENAYAITQFGVTPEQLAFGIPKYARKHPDYSFAFEYYSEKIDRNAVHMYKSVLTRVPTFFNHLIGPRMFAVDPIMLLWKLLTKLMPASDTNPSYSMEEILKGYGGSVRILTKNDVKFDTDKFRGEFLLMLSIRYNIPTKSVDGVATDMISILEALCKNAADLAGHASIAEAQKEYHAKLNVYHQKLRGMFLPNEVHMPTR